MVIERLLGLELTDQISFRYEFSKLWRAKQFLFAAFQAAILGLFAAVLPIFTDASLLAAFIIFAALMAFESFYYYHRISPDKLRGSVLGSDWAVDRVQCQRGDQE